MHVFRRLSARTYIPHENSRTRHILGMSNIPRNDYCRLRLCRLSCMLIPSTPHKIPLPGAVLWGICKNPTQFGNFSRVYAPGHRFTSVVSNMVEIGAGNAVLYWWQKKTKHLFGAVLRNPWGDFPEIFHASVHCGPTLIFQVSSKYVQVSGTYNRKTLPRPQKWKQYRLLWACDNSRFI